MRRIVVHCTYCMYCTLYVRVHSTDVILIHVSESLESFVVTVHSTGTYFLRVRSTGTLVLLLSNSTHCTWYLVPQRAKNFPTLFVLSFCISEPTVYAIYSIQNRLLAWEEFELECWMFWLNGRPLGSRRRNTDRKTGRGRGGTIVHEH
jgi:hypothetical protein